MIFGGMFAFVMFDYAILDKGERLECFYNNLNNHAGQYTGHAGVVSNRRN